MSDLLPFAVRPKIYAYTTPEYKGKNWLKIGYTTRDVRVRVAEQFGVVKPDSPAYEIVLETDALRYDGTYFTDKDLHRFLKSKGIKHINGEWFEISPETLDLMIDAFKSRTQSVDVSRRASFKMRPEQQRAVDITAAYFKEFSYEKQGKTPHFLWNAKMRFGKTFAAYQLALKMGWKKILVLTFKPAVESAWQEDLISHQDFKSWQFVARDVCAYDDIDSSKPFVWFASFQDLLGKNELGGIKARNEAVHAINWDCIILDEYHFGAWRENAKDLYDAEAKEDVQPDYYDEDLMPLTTGAYLYLSGTPFRALNNGEFLEDQIFNWTYSDEQREKETWNTANGENPYAELPKMVLMTYQMPAEIRRVALQGEFDEFDLNEFFKAEEKDGKFIFKYENEVQNWLNLIRGQYLPTNVDSLKTGKRPPMPFSDVRLSGGLNHTFWFLPNVAACKAMAALLKSKGNTFYHDYEIIVCAGNEAGMGVEALKPVKAAMGRNPLETKSITLSCGKLITGVSVKPWTGIFMLRNTSSPETYFQAAFRVQTPWKLVNPTELNPNETEIIKQVCYVFDFAPDRALKQISEYSARLDLNSRDTPEKRVEEFIKFLPVLCYDGETMNILNAGELLDMVVSGTASTMLAKRWESALLVNVDNETLKKLLDTPEAMKALENIEGFRALNKELQTIINKSEALKKAKKEAKDNPSTTEKKELTAEEKEIKSKRQIVREKLLKFATRIPVFMYLTDAREQCLKDVITQLEPSLFQKVTGLTIKDFNLLVGIGIFNAQVMNGAIFAFKRYEDASLSYTGLNRHAGELVGGWDTQLTVEELRQG